MKQKVLILLLLIFVLALSACAGEQANNPQAAVTGEVIKLDAALLPSGAVVEVHLLDVSRQDVEGAEISTFTRELGDDQLPVGFELPYDPEAIQPQGIYTVRAVVRDAGGNLLYTSTKAITVITEGAPVRNVVVIVEPV